jgi:hypothetical protein
VRPLYEAAYASTPQVTDPALLNYLKLPYFGEALRAGRKLQALEDGFEATPAFLNSTDVSLKDLDYLKRGLDQQIDRLSGLQGKRQEAAALRAKKNDLVGQLDNLSNDSYQQARQAYAQGIEQQVAPLENGLVGTLAQLEPQQAAFASRIFTDPGVTADQVAIFKAAVSQKNPDAYRGLVRQYLDDAYDKAQVITQGGDTSNIPGKFLKTLAPTPSKEQRLKAILPADALPALEGLLDAAEKLAATPLGASRVAGSPTSSNISIGEALKGRAVATLRALITPRQAIRDAAELRAQEQGVIDLTEALIDPAKRDQLKRIVRMKDSTKQAILLGTLFTGQAAAGEASDLTENSGLGQ